MLISSHFLGHEGLSLILNRLVLTSGKPDLDGRLWVAKPW